jgi:hypothetical protein
LGEFSNEATAGATPSIADENRRYDDDIAEDAVRDEVVLFIRSVVDGNKFDGRTSSFNVSNA